MLPFQKAFFNVSRLNVAFEYAFLPPLLFHDDCEEVLLFLRKKCSISPSLMLENSCAIVA